MLQDHTLNSKGVLCVWDLSATAAPHAILVSEGSPTCCCWAPAPSTSLVFAGEVGEHAGAETGAGQGL